MATEMITLKMDSRLLKEVDKAAKNGNYQSRTEFIRNSLREGIDKEKLKEAMMSIAHLKGASKKKTTDEEIEKIREKAFEELSKKFR